jgi:hypothetical protein
VQESPKNIRYMHAETSARDTHTHTVTHMHMTGEFPDVSKGPFPFAETLGDTRDYRQLLDMHKADMQFRGKVVVS